MEFGPDGSAERCERAADWVLERDSLYDIFEFVLAYRHQRAFISGLLRVLGRRSLDEHGIVRVERLLYNLLIDVDQWRADWLFEAMRGWPTPLAQRLVLPWCQTAGRREVFAPTSASTEELTVALMSAEASRVARALAIVAGLPPREPKLALRPFGIAVLERAGASTANCLTFLRVVTQFRGFAPKLRRADRIRLAIETLVRTDDGEVSFYAADWLLAQGQAELAVDAALAHLARLAPATAEWTEVGVDFLWRLWSRAPLGLRAAVDASMHAHLGAPERELDALQAWLKSSRRR